MAGIGFRLQKLLKEDTYTALVKGYLYSAIISSGPMLTSIICIAILGVLSFPVLSTNDYLIFRTTIVYTFAFSLIYTGIFQMVTTRYVADRLFMKEHTSLIPCFVSLFFITMLNQTALGVFFFSHVLSQWQYVAVATGLYVIISCLWNTMIFITATKNYAIIFFGFLVGSLTSLGAGHFAGIQFGLIGYLMGFTLGQVLILIFLIASFIKEFDFFKPIDFNFLLYFRKYPELCAAGLLINLAVWIDKFSFWFSAYGIHIQGWFYTFPWYDSAFFLAYLSIVPALSLFLVRVETSFYHKYRQYYSLIMNKATLYQIESAKNDIITDLKESTLALLKIQGFVTVVLIITATTIVHLTRLPWVALVMFKIGILAAFLLIFFQLLLIIMFYFEFRKEALALTILFLGINFFATMCSIKLGIRFFGFGFFAACFISLFAGYFLLQSRLNNLEYLTFTFQPIQKVKI